MSESVNIMEQRLKVDKHFQDDLQSIEQSFKLKDAKS